MADLASTPALGTVSLFRDRALVIVISVTLIEVMGTMSIGPALPGIAQAFALSPEQIGLVTTAFVLPILLGAPIFGVLADRFGRKKILLPSLFLFAAAGTGVAFAPTFEALLALRFLQGVGAASLEALALALLADLYSGRRLTTAMGLNASMIAAGLAVYPLIGGGLASLGWQYVFALPLLAVVVGVWMWTALDEPQEQTNTTAFDLKGYLADIWHSVRRPEVLRVLLLVAAVFVLLFGTLLTYLPMLAAERGASEVEIGLLITCMALAFLLASSQLGFLADRLPRRTIVRTAFVFYAVALALAPILPGVWALGLTSVLFGLAHGLIFPATQAQLAELAPAAGRAGFMALVAVAVPLGQTVGPIASGWTFAAWGLDGVFYGGAGVALLLFLVLTLNAWPTKPSTLSR